MIFKVGDRVVALWTLRNRAVYSPGRSGEVTYKTLQEGTVGKISYVEEGGRTGWYHFQTPNQRVLYSWLRDYEMRKISPLEQLAMESE